MLAAQRNSKQNDARTSGAGRRVARRPQRGLEIKEDTYAILKLVRVDGMEIPLIDSSSPDGQTSSGYANFMLQTVTEPRMEKHQIVETFGASYIFFFGESPRFLDVTAVLVNSHDFNWEAEWWENYNTYLRGTKSVELAARTYLFYDDNIVEGYILMANAVKTSDQPLMVSLTFKMFVTNYQNISFIGDPAFPIRASVNLPPGIELTDGNAGGALIEKFRNAARDVIIQNGGDPAATTISDLIGNGLPAGRSINEFLRSASPSIGVSPETWATIENLEVDGSTLADKYRELAERTGNPIRGLIAENLDEYTGVPAQTGRLVPDDTGPTSALAPMVRSATESDDLFRDSIEFLACFGAFINSPHAFAGLGLSVNFGASASAGVTASFTPQARTAFGFGTTPQLGFPQNQQLSPFNRDPLGAVYGQARFQTGVFGSNTPDPNNRYALGAGDPGYGYPSSFASGPGFGIAGFGDMGGLGFGGPYGATGDPGYRDPTKFTFAGVADNRSAFQRFLLPKPSPTILGITPGLGGAGIPGVGVGIGVGSGVFAGAGIGVGAVAGLGGGASVGIGGKPSPFSMIALDGTLDETGQARSDPQNVSNFLARNLIGFTNPNPFGVRCPLPGVAVGAGIRAGVGVGVGVGVGGGAGVGAGIGVGLGGGTTISAGVRVTI